MFFRNSISYVDDKEYLKEAQSFCAELLTALTQELLEKGISSQFFLVGSGARNMVTQNNKKPIDFDYNLNIQKYENIRDCRTIKEIVRKTFNKILRQNDLSDCEDSTSSLTTKPIYFSDSEDIEFKIDLCIVTQDSKDLWFRLIHRKTGNTYQDEYYWNQAPNSKCVKSKAYEIKQVGEWQLVRDKYLGNQECLLEKQ